MTDYSKIPDSIGELKIGDTYLLVVVGVSDSSVRELAPSEATLSCEIDALMPPMSRFGGGREQKKQVVIAKLKRFFEKYCGIGDKPLYGSEERDEYAEMRERGAEELAAEARVVEVRAVEEHAAEARVVEVRAVDGRGGYE